MLKLEIPGQIRFSTRNMKKSKTEITSTLILLITVEMVGKTKILYEMKDSLK